MIAISHLNKTFAAKPVLQDVELTVTGPIVLMGASGGGKTTLLRILMGLESPDSGEVTGIGPIGAVFQESRLCPQLTAPANICLTGGGVTEPEACEALISLGFAQGDLALPASKLSGGQQRRTALLRALLCRTAQTLLLDEPFTGMDADLVERAAALTKQLVNGRDTILVTHDRRAADFLGWPVYELNDNQIRCR